MPAQSISKNVVCNNSAVSNNGTCYLVYRRSRYVLGWLSYFKVSRIRHTCVVYKVQGLILDSNMLVKLMFLVILEKKITRRFPS